MQGFQVRVVGTPEVGMMGTTVLVVTDSADRAMELAMEHFPGATVSTVKPEKSDIILDRPAALDV